MASNTAPRWTGMRVEHTLPCAVVKYLGPTDSRCSRWSATVMRGHKEGYRHVVSFDQGPLVAAELAMNKAGLDHLSIRDCAYINEDTYCVTFCFAGINA